MKLLEKSSLNEFEHTLLQNMLVYHLLKNPISCCVSETPSPIHYEIDTYVSSRMGITIVATSEITKTKVFIVKNAMKHKSKTKDTVAMGMCYLDIVAPSEPSDDIINRIALIHKQQQVQIIASYDSGKIIAIVNDVVNTYNLNMKGLK